MDTPQEWTMDDIVADLRRSMWEKEKLPVPILLKRRYGFELNSEFFPILVEIQKLFPDLHGLMEELWKRTDPRDLSFRGGACTCPKCRG